MEKVFSTVSGFLTGLGSLFMALIPVSILWFVLTGGSVFGMDVIANLTALVNGFGEGGFVGLIVLILVASFFTGKK
tara:strand:- start:18 stop:245 length:228 start_codon:yes stop_codon:yes gene_type:complete